jgi:hypothetical protein
MSAIAELLDDTYDYSDPELVGYQDRLRHLHDTKGVTHLRLGPRVGPMLLRYADVKEGFANSKCFSKSLALRHITFSMMGARQANEEFARNVSPLVKRRPAEPANDLLSVIGTAEVEGQGLDDAHISLRGISSWPK